MTKLVLEEKLVSRIADIGKSRSPNEACGIMLPTEINGVQVIELENLSDSPHDSFEVHGDSILDAVLQVVPDLLDWPNAQAKTFLQDLTVWHTHPKGNVGPSRFDLKNKPANLHSLVVSLDPLGGHLATWF